MRSTTVLKALKILIGVTFISIILISFSSFILMVGFMDLVVTLSTYYSVIPFLFIFLVILSSASLLIGIMRLHSTEEFEVFPEILKY